MLLTGCNSDLYTKRLAENSLKDKPPVPIFDGYLELRYAENEGAAFSLLHGLPAKIRQPLLVSLALIPIIAMAVFIFLSRKKSIFILLPFLITLSGALGNIINRLQSGYIVDFIYFHVRDRFSWPIFNLADVLVYLGVGLLLLQVILNKETIINIKTRK